MHSMLFVWSCRVKVMHGWQSEMFEISRPFTTTGFITQLSFSTRFDALLPTRYLDS